MAYRKKTLRSMSPITRKLAGLRGELASIDRRLKNLIPEVKEIERKATLDEKRVIKVVDKLAGG